ncbi:MAG TPA: MdtA/MuxA family multidrug efflux RND transporter periplasmic adaptor subunit [Alphaproteobacteria bacterium]|nr:MdtA/MuxA family multidrug efflux RND transporter periplasmic adaptor subunit [Alphaproteobacteria bacterium]
MNERNDQPREVRESRAAEPRRPRERRWTRGRIVGIAVVLLVLAAIAWIARPRPAQPPRPGRFAVSGAMPVVADVAKPGDIDITYDGLGTVTPLATVTVRTQINGQLTQIAFQEGQLVHKGDFLAQIDPRPYQLALEQAQGQLQRDQALLKNAEIDLARYQTLVRQDSIARQQLDTQQYLVHQYQGTVTVDQAQVDNAKLNLAYCHITAPVTGRVGLRLVDPGNYVQTSDTAGIVVITQLQPISVVFTLPEDDLPAIMKRLRAGATLEVAAYDRSNTTRLATGKLQTVDNQIDITTGTVKLKAQFDNEDESLFPNQFVNIRLLVNVLHAGVVVPSSAVQRGAPGTYVYLIKPDSTVTVRPVKLGPSQGETVAIESGLQPGDKVVVDGADKLREGAQVTLPSTPGNGAAIPPAGAAPNTGQGSKRSKRP